jgi:transcriptional regulator
MYAPSHFSFDDRESIVSFARENSFATLVSVDGIIPYATHVPLLVECRGDDVILSGHFSGNNPHCDLIGSSGQLAIFHGSHAYISPSWYREPGVPTWNYAAVHMYGDGSLIEDPDELAGVVNTLSEIHEASSPKPWVPRYSATMLRAIRGFRIHVYQIEGKRKLSQNRSERDRRGVVAGLASPFGRQPDGNQQEVRRLMQKDLESL